MAGFVCDGCGKCCTSFGKLIRIERQLTGQDYFCRDRTTGELFQVHVLPEFADEIGDEYEEPDGGKTPAGPRGCPFLCKRMDGKGFSCAVYPTRPAICREFRCYRMLIRHAETGEIRGKIIGKGQLSTRDEVLLSLWNEKIACLPGHPASKHDPVQHSHTPGARLHTRMQGSGQGDDREWMASVIAILASNGYKGEPVE
nr:YkgJ family cysteine cluster protein [uncultured Methanoregula sp.]